MAEQATDRQQPTTPNPKPTPLPKRVFKPKKTREELEEQVLLECYQDPRRFVRYFFGVEPTKQQDEILGAMRFPGAHVTVRSGHGIGKSTVMAWLILWLVLFHKDCKVPCTAPSGHQLKDVLWAEIAKWHQKMPQKFRDELVLLADRIVHNREPKTRFAVARTARKEKPDALQGFHATEIMFLVDEAAGVDEAVFTVAESALTTANARVLLCGNPTRTDGYFFDSHKHPEISKEWTKLNFSSADSPLASKEWIERVRRKYGEQHPFWKIRVLGEFPDVSANLLIPFSYLERAKNAREVLPAGLRIAGLDVARFGDDRSALVIRHGNVVTTIQVWNGYSTVETARRATALSGLYDVICVDEIGVGGGAVDILREGGKVRVVPVNVSRSSDDPQFSRLRDQLWFATRDWFCKEEPVYITPQNHAEDMIAELAGIHFAYYQGTERLKIDSKDEMKKTLGYSPDIADALTMTFATPFSALGGTLGMHKTARSMGAIFSQKVA